MKCNYCTNEAKTTFTFKQDGREENVCYECYAKLLYQENFNMETGDSLSLDDITIEDVRGMFDENFKVLYKNSK